MPVAQANPDVLNIWRPEDQARVQTAIDVELARIDVFEDRIQLDASDSSSTDAAAETTDDAAADTAADATADAAAGTRRLQAAQAVVEYDKQTIYDSFEYSPFDQRTVISFEEEIDLAAIKKRIEENDGYHKEEDKDVNAGAIAGCVIGAVLLIGMLAYCMWKACMKSKGAEMSSARGGARNGQTVLVNQSAMSINSN